MAEWFAISELAEKTNIAESTVRRYLNNFDVFFHSKGGKRSRQFEGAAVKVLGRIRELFDKGYESVEVHRKLSEEFGMIIDGESSEVKDDNKAENTDATALATGEDVAAIRALLEEQKVFNTRILELLHKQEIRIQQQESIIQQMAETQKQIAATTETEDHPEESETPKKDSFFHRLFKKKE